MNKPIYATYDCQVWDSVSHEWARLTVKVPTPLGPRFRDTEREQELGLSLNIAVSEEMGEDRDAWILKESNTMHASGEEVVMLQLWSKANKDDFSVVLAVRDFQNEVVHISPAINEECSHEWACDETGNPEQCTKCGLSFTRYVHCCCP